jgi:amidase
MTDAAPDLALRNATELAELIRRRRVSARELLDTVLARYERWNPVVNAVVVTQIDQARDRAAQADAATARGESWGPLHGLPMTIKEAFDWAGTPTTWGIPALARNRPTRNASTVDRLLGAGAVIYGKTNVPLALGDWQSFNAIYGTTANPWDPDRTPGGSSGGSAASLATGMAALELGSDIGASIRNPAHYCGVFGHKPTYGLVPMRGATFPGRVSPPDIDVAGPLARSAADLALALGVLAGPDQPDAAVYQWRPPAPRHRSLSGVRAAVLLESPCVEQDAELTEQLRATVDALGRAGVRIDDGAAPEVDQRRAFEVYLLLLRAATGVNATAEEVEGHRAAAARYDAGERDYRAIVGKGVTLGHRDWFELHEERQRMRWAWAELFAEHDVLLCPTAASAAFVHDHAGERADRTIEVNGRPQPAVDQLFWAGFSGMVYLPGTVVPAGRTRSGLPCGLQIVVPHLADVDGIAVAGLIERELGGFVPPPGG